MKNPKNLGWYGKDTLYTDPREGFVLNTSHYSGLYHVEISNLGEVEYLLEWDFEGDVIDRVAIYPELFFRKVPSVAQVYQILLTTPVEEWWTVSLEDNPVF